MSFLGDTKVRFISTRRRSPVEDCDGDGSGGGGKRAGPATNVISPFLFRWEGREDRLSFPLSYFCRLFSSLCRAVNGGKEIEELY